MSKTSGSSALLRTLRIKTSVLARLQKDVTAYTAETTTAHESVEKWRNMDPSDRDENWEWNVKNAEKVVKDCQQMIPLTKEKAQAALEELADLVVRNFSYYWASLMVCPGNPKSRRRPRHTHIE
jgi:predicted RNA-binding protein with PUA-like domain